LSKKFIFSNLLKLFWFFSNFLKFSRETSNFLEKKIQKICTFYQYSELGCFIITEFWCKPAIIQVGQLSKAFAFNTPSEVDLAFERDWKM
jgi:hypothetical protein